MKKLFLFLISFCLVGLVYPEGLDADTVLLLHMDGTDTSTDFPDSSFSNHTVSAEGTGQVDTSEKVFGTGSFKGDGDTSALSMQDSDDWYFGTENFTIDFWIKFNNVGLYSQLTNQLDGVDGEMHGYVTNAKYVRFVWDDANNVRRGSYQSSGPLSLVNDTWYHMAFVRNGTTGIFFLGGVVITMTEQTAFGTNDLTTLA